jgi:hypothetical protein
MLKTIASHLREIARVAGASQLESYLERSGIIISEMIKDCNKRAPVVFRGQVKVPLKKDIPLKEMKNKLHEIKQGITVLTGSLEDFIGKSAGMHLNPGDTVLSEELGKIKVDIDKLYNLAKTNSDALDVMKRPYEVETKFKNINEIGGTLASNISGLQGLIMRYFRSFIN